MPNTDTLLSRALAAYYRAAKKTHPFAQAMQPSKYSGVVEHDGRTLVQLVNVNGTLALYELLTSGRIRSVSKDRWPTELANKY